jgi:hypothetical protein
LILTFYLRLQQCMAAPVLENFVNAGDKKFEFDFHGSMPQNPATRCKQ